jgi:hypothetical protein
MEKPERYKPNSHANRGKEFEKIVQFSLRQLPDLFWHKTKPYYNGFGQKAYPEKGLLDYLCCYDGAIIMFDAKSTQENAFPSALIKPHQLKLAQGIQNAGGVAFFLAKGGSLSVETLRDRSTEIRCFREGGRPIINLKAYFEEILPLEGT